MTETSPHLRSIDDLPDRVLAIAVRPGDCVRACGGTLALHLQRGDDVQVVVVGAGSDGNSDGAAALEAEVRSALAVLGTEAVEFLGLALADDDPEPLAALHELALGKGPNVIYLPSPFDHADHRRLLRNVQGWFGAGSSLPAGEVLMYSVRAPSLANVTVDTTATLDTKRDALARFAQEQVVERVIAADRASAGELGRGDGAAPEAVERFLRLPSHPSARAAWSAAQLSRTAEDVAQWPTDTESSRRSVPPVRVTAVISTWNKCDDVRENLAGLREQAYPFWDVVVVDNASSDETAEMIWRDFPEVRLTVMPHSAYGACETFNIGFACAEGDFIAILDDDVVLPPDWLEKTLARMLAEPDTTAIVSTKIVEPEMPESYKTSEAINTERYMSTFRGCASLARTSALREAGGYDERLFIYGNERDLTCRLLNLGYRVLQYPEAEAFHKTPFGIKMGKRSLYYHARNAWLSMLKYAPAKDLARMPFLVVSKVLLRGRQKEVAGEVSDATGTIGIARSIRETKGAWLVIFKAACSVLWNVPYCLRRRQPCKAQDFELPIE